MQSRPADMGTEWGSANMERTSWRVRGWIIGKFSSIIIRALSLSREQKRIFGKIVDIKTEDVLS